MHYKLLVSIWEHAIVHDVALIHISLVAYNQYSQYSLYLDIHLTTYISKHLEVLLLSQLIKQKMIHYRCLEIYIGFDYTTSLDIWKL